MKIEKLGVGKIKVTVSHLELDTWNINPKAISPDSPQLREFIGSMIARSAGETGIELSGSNVLVEARAQGEEFVFIITTVGASTEKLQKEISRSIKRQRLMSGKYRTVTRRESTHSYYWFVTLKEFAEMLGCVGCDLFANASLYKFEKGYIVAVKKELPEHGRCCAVMAEYANELTSPNTADYVREYASLFANGKDFRAIMNCYL